MKNLKEKIKNVFRGIKWSKLILVILILAVLGGLFYWYEARPALAYYHCSNKAVNKLTEDVESKSVINTINDADVFYTLSYRICLRSKGINK